LDTKGVLATKQIVEPLHVKDARVRSGADSGKETTQEVNPMLNWLKSLFQTGQETGRVRQLEREVQSLRVMLADQDKVIAQLRNELQKHRNDTEVRVQKSAQVVIEKLMADVAILVTKLNSQAYVVEEQNRPLNVRDVLTVAKQFMQVFQNFGLRLEGYVGEMTSFDPDHHLPLKNDVTFVQGEPVIVRFVGVAYRGKLLRKARVEGSRTKQRSIDLKQKSVPQTTR
jgi:molecular chaperone GrpE (heat shock protein)